MTSLYTNNTVSSCPAQSLGSMNNLVTTLVQALLAAQCAITPAWPEDYGDVALHRGLGEYDFVVVGAGSAGSVMASRLSENPQWNVLVLEAGGDPPQESEVPLLLSALQHTDYSWNYWTEPNGRACLGTGNGSCYWPSGKMIGGSGAINGMLYIRGIREDYDDWERLGNTNWGWNDVLPYFVKSVTPSGDEEQPVGYVTIDEYPSMLEEVQAMIYGGAAELGIPRVPTFDDGSEVGYTNVLGTLQNGHRTSPGRGHLGAVLNRPNLHMIKNAQASRINFDHTGEKVESLTFVLRGTHELTVPVGKELVVSAGSIQSPKLLMLSGVGHSEHLSEFGLPTVHDLPVGDNLKDHILAPIFIKLNEHTAPVVESRFSLDDIFNYLIHANGQLGGLNLHAVTAFINTLRDRPYPDIHQHHLLYQRGNYDGLRSLLVANAFQDYITNQTIAVLRDADILVVYVVLTHPKTTGHLRLQTNSYVDDPIMAPNYFAYPEDVETVIRGINHVQNMVNTRSFQAHRAEILPLHIEECALLPALSDHYWRCYIKYITVTLHHHISTVKMGAEADPTACVNPRLKLKGVRNLRVVDASVMPDMPSCNTNAPTIMIAERGADFIKEDWSQSQSQSQTQLHGYQYLHPFY